MRGVNFSLPKKYQGTKVMPNNITNLQPHEPLLA